MQPATRSFRLPASNRQVQFNRVDSEELRHQILAELWGVETLVELPESVDPADECLEMRCQSL